MPYSLFSDCAQNNLSFNEELLSDAYILPFPPSFGPGDHGFHTLRLFHVHDVHTFVHGGMARQSIASTTRTIIITTLSHSKQAEAAVYSGVLGQTICISYTRSMGRGGERVETPESLAYAAGRAQALKKGKITWDEVT